MITDDQDPEMEIRAFFEHDLKLTVTRIPVSVLRSADFLVDGDGAGYVLEVKARFDDKESTAALRAGEVVAGAESLGWARWASDGVRAGVPVIKIGHSSVLNTIPVCHSNIADHSLALRSRTPRCELRAP